MQTLNVMVWRAKRTLAVAASYWRAVARRFASSDENVVLVIMFTGSGSFGDQAMVQSIASHVHLLGGRYFQLVMRPQWSDFEVDGPQLPILRLDTNSEGGIEGTAPLRRTIARACAVVAIGADIIDGNYGVAPIRYLVDILRISAKMGKPTALMGSSMSANPTPDALRLLKSLPESVVVQLRDPVSLRRYEAATGRAGRLVADLAFLVEPDTKSRFYSSAINWASRQRENGRRIIALNVNALLQDTQRGAVEFWSTVIHKLDQQAGPVAVLLIPHDVRPNVSDLDLLQALLHELENKWANRVLLASGLRTAALAKSIAASADLVITGRMHLAIGALSLGIPTYCIAYAGKFEGLGQHLGIEDLVIPAELLASSESVAAWVADQLDSAPERRDHLQRTLPHVKNLAERNFSFALGK